MKTRALVVTEPGVVGVREVEVGSPGPGEVLVEVAWSTVSPGTEGRVVAGKQMGAPAFPLILGYSSAGVIVKAGEDLASRIGERVFCAGTPRADIASCWGGHVGHALLPSQAALRIPDGVDLRSASAAKLAAIAYQGLKLARPLPHESVAVVGLGPIGLFSALHFQAAGANVLVMDLAESRRSVARSFGLGIVGNGQEDWADIVVDATGASGALAGSVRLARSSPWDGLDHRGARLVIQGSYAEPPPLPYDEIFMRELKVLVPRDNSRADLVAVLDLMERKLLDCGGLLEDFGDPENAAACFARPHDAVPVTGCFRWSSRRD